MSGGHRRTKGASSGSTARGRGTSRRSSGTSRRSSGTSRRGMSRARLRELTAFTPVYNIASGNITCPVCGTPTAIAASVADLPTAPFTPRTELNNGWFVCPECRYQSKLFIEDESDESDHASDDPEAEGDYKDPFRQRTPPPSPQSMARRTVRSDSWFH